MGRKAAAVGADGNGKAAIVIVVAVSVVAPTGESNAGIVVLPLLECIRVSNAPVMPLGFVVDLSHERSGIISEAAESGRGGEAGCGV